jgi:hypothetical protein
MQQTSDRTTSSTPARQDEAGSSRRRHSRTSVAHTNRQETPAQEADAMEEIEEVLSAPDDPEDRVEVVIMSQEPRLKGDAIRTSEFPLWPRCFVRRNSEN